MDTSDLQEKDIDLLIAAYLSGSATGDEQVKLHQWIGANNDNLVYFNKLKNAWILSGGRKNEFSGQAGKSWNKLKSKIDSEVPRQENADKLKPVTIPFKRYLRIAATWILLFGLGSLVTMLVTHPKDDHRHSLAVRNIEISTPLGARSMIKMPDSTVVWLNAGTKIRYKEDYGRTNRSLDLMGEAYFSVAKDSLHPFIVNTQGVFIRALGTRFNVKAYPEEKTISATLEEGHIDIGVGGLTEKDQRVLLKPKDKFIYHKATKETEKYTESADDNIKTETSQRVKPKGISLLSNVRTELYTSWKDPRWIIFREPLNTLAPMIERRYNLKIIFDNDQLRKYKFTGTVENETVDQILNALKLTAPLDYTITKDTIRLTLDRQADQTFKRIMTKNN